MNKLALIASTLALSATPTFAADAVADLPVSPAYNWTGGYIGVQGGYSWFDAVQAYPGLPDSAQGEMSPDTFTLGAQAGYRYEFSNDVVAGIEADVFSYFDKGSTSAIPGSSAGTDLTVRYGGSLRGQLGYAVDRFLPYVTGGVAFIDYKGATALVPGGTIIAGSEYNETKAGWTVGAGLAYAISDNLVANVDYRYSDFGSSTFNTPPVAAGQTSVDIKDSAIKLGLSYKF